MTPQSHACLSKVKNKDHFNSYFPPPVRLILDPLSPVDHLSTSDLISDLAWRPPQAASTVSPTG